MTDRRHNERRVAMNTPEEKISRIRERRMGDRRDSPRAPMTFLVRDCGEDASDWVERQGELSLGGIHWIGTEPPKGAVVDVRFRLPGFPKEVRAQGEVLRVVQDGEAERMRVRFTELDVLSELAIAKYLDDQIAAGALT